MKKVIIVLISLVEISAFGSLFPGVTGKIVQKEVRLKATDGLTCSNFSGNWKGGCDNDGGLAGDVNVIQVGCSFLILNDHLYPIGGQSGDTLAIPASDETGDAAVFQTSSIVSWNADHTALRTGANIQAQPLVLGKAGGQFSITGEMRVNGQQLLNTFVFQNQLVTCTYTK